VAVVANFRRFLSFRTQRNKLCPLATVSRHACDQRGHNCGQKPRVAPPRWAKALRKRGDCYRKLRRIPLPRSWVNRALRDPPYTLTGVRRSCSPRVETRHRWRPHRTGSVGRRGRPAPRWGIYVTCFRSRPFRTAGGRWAGRPGSLPPSGWTASRPVRARCPGRCRGTAAFPGRRPQGR
jgi:hypothetical protein